jgi:anti-anti-sigma regulatory factor
MTLRIEKSCDEHSTTVRLSGRLVGSHRRALSEQIEGSRGTILLDLEEVTLVDIDIVHFLARSEAEGVELLHCPAYLREWISKENERRGRV